MGLLDGLKQSITGKPINIKNPIFIKEESSSKIQIEKLRQLLDNVQTESVKQIELDLKLLSYGMSGEENVAYELKNSFMPILILHDLFLEYNGLTAQIDYVVIDSKFVLIIECKKMVGDIEITSKGDFIRSFKSSTGKIYKKEGIYSPIVQNQRHLELIKRILIENTKKITEKNSNDILRSIVVLANPKSILNDKFAKKEVKNQIIKHDQLINYMNLLHKTNKDGMWFPEDGMYFISDILLKYHKENPVDYSIKYNLKVQMPTTLDDTKIISDSLNGEPNQAISKPVEEISSFSSLEETPIYQDLKVYRYNKSKDECIKAYYIFNNVQLEEIIRTMPKSFEDLKQIKGFAEVKCQKYGQDILDLVKNYN